MYISFSLLDSAVCVCWLAGPDTDGGWTYFMTFFFPFMLAIMIRHTPCNECLFRNIWKCISFQPHLRGQRFTNPPIYPALVLAKCSDIAVPSFHYYQDHDRLNTVQRKQASNGRTETSRAIQDVINGAFDNSVRLTKNSDGRWADDRGDRDHE